MILREKWKQAHQALSDAKQARALKIIANIFAVINVHHNEDIDVETVDEMRIRCTARHRRIESLYKADEIEFESFLRESAKLDDSINGILKDLRLILEKIDENKIEITTVNNKVIDVKTSVTYALNEEEFLDIVKILAQKLSVNVENMKF
jgi:hypothetical protein